jgi:hypothetical protein
VDVPTRVTFQAMVFVMMVDLMPMIGCVTSARIALTVAIESRLQIRMPKANLLKRQNT